MDCNFICNKELHHACSYYQTEEKSIVEILNFEARETIHRLKAEGQMVFVIRGKVDFSYSTGKTLRAGENDCFIVPRKIRFSIRFNQPTTLLIFNITLGESFCSRIYDDIFNIAPVAFCGQSSVIEANSLIKQHIEIVCMAIDKGFLCTAFFYSQLQCLLNLICAFYPKDIVMQFFAPLVSYSFREVADDRFRSTVLQMQDMVFSVRKLAELTGQNIVSFRRHFERLFGMNPHQWITENRKQIIYRELKINTLTLDEIAAKVGLGSASDLHRYCRKYFGTTVKSIRKNNGHL
jgi:AraC-like DNA-binding protein